MSRFRDWVENRTGVSELFLLLGKKDVPQHRHTLWYYCGGAILMLFGLQVVSGLLLLLYYKPTTDAAHASISRIMTEIPLGWLIRSLHHWAAHLLIVLVLVHVVSTSILKAFRRPRELTWFTGYLLLVVTLAFGFTGYLLPWDELSLAATKVGSDIVHEVPVIGAWMGKVMRGGEDVTDDTLTRFFAFHVCYLPAALLVFAGLHLLLVQRHGMSVPPSVESRSVGRLPFHPNFVYRELILWLALLGAVTTLAALAPAHLGSEADLMSPAPAGVKPEWYFLFLFQVLRVFPANVWFLSGDTVAVNLTLLGVILVLLLPLLDSKPQSRRSRWIIYGTYAFLLYAILMSVWGYLS